MDSSFRGDAKHRTRNLEIPGLVLTRHPGMTEYGLLRRFAPRNDGVDGPRTASMCQTGDVDSTRRREPSMGEISMIGFGFGEERISGSRRRCVGSGGGASATAAWPSGEVLC